MGSSNPSFSLPVLAPSDGSSDLLLSLNCLVTSSHLAPQEVQAAKQIPCVKFLWLKDLM